MGYQHTFLSEFHFVQEDLRFIEAKTLHKFTMLGVKPKGQIWVHYHCQNFSLIFKQFNLIFTLVMFHCSKTAFKILKVQMVLYILNLFLILSL